MKKTIIALLAFSLILTACANNIPAASTGETQEQTPVATTENSSTKPKALSEEDQAERNRKEANFAKENEDKLPQPLEKGQSIPDFTLKDLDGKDVRLSDYKGKLLILDFFTTRCYYCVEEMPDMVEFQKRYRDKDVVLLPVSIGESKESVQAFLKKHNLDTPVLLDEKGELMKIFGAYATPTHSFIDKNQLFMGNSMGQLSLEKLCEFVDKILAEQK